MHVKTTASVAELREMLIGKFAGLTTTATLWHKGGVNFKELDQARLKEMSKADPAACVIWARQSQIT